VMSGSHDPLRRRRPGSTTTCSPRTLESQSSSFVNSRSD
jgi:hypothetical protein